MTERLENILITGGSGFIGSNFIRYIFEQTGFGGKIINCDALTYAGNPLNLKDMDEKYGDRRYFFEKLDIRSYDDLDSLFETYSIDTVIHFAAESHVDRSISGPKDFITTNINGTFNLLEAAREHWNDYDNKLFHHISTDEVYGSLGDEGYFREDTPYNPRSPYSASKASSDHLVRAYYHTYDLPITISNCSNNYGPYQFPEKLIPVVLLNALEGKDIPVYGDGKNVRDWLFVEDHCEAIFEIITSPAEGETFNIGGECERQNIELVNRICDLLEDIKPSSNNPSLDREINYRDLITFVEDRPGHDRRYAMDISKIKNELDWTPSTTLEKGLTKTINWYLNNPGWIESVKTGEYREWMEDHYE